MKEKLNIFKTIRKDDALPMRKLGNLAEIIQIAYNLFQDDFLNAETGDPFLRLAEDEAIYSIVNRATVEHTINQTLIYAEVSFQGTYLKVSSIGIEEYLKELEVIVLAVEGMKAAGDEAKERFPVETSLFIYNAMGKLLTMIYYFLNASQNFIAMIRVRQLNENIMSVPETGRKAYLLREKTDLLKNKHEIRNVKSELIRVIELELDLLRQLDSTIVPEIKHSALVPTTEHSTKTPLPASIDRDFKYEMSIFDFPFKKTIEADPISLELLKLEFGILTAIPKSHWYFQDYIGEEQWAKHSINKFETKDPGIIALNTEQLAGQLIRDFSRMAYDKTVDPKYYGRHLKDTTMVNTLRDIDQKLTDFNEHVILNGNIDNYESYANVAVADMLKAIERLPVLNLQLLILQEIIDLSIEKDFILRLRLLGLEQRHPEQAQISSRYKILKLYANVAFDKAKTALIANDVLANPSSINNKLGYLSLFRDHTKSQFYLSLLNSCNPPIIDHTGHYILGDRKKASIMAWFDALKTAGKITPFLTWQEKESLINGLIPGLGITKRALQSSTVKVYNQYLPVFEEALKNGN